MKTTEKLGSLRTQGNAKKRHRAIIDHFYQKDLAGQFAMIRRQKTRETALLLFHELIREEQLDFYRQYFKGFKVNHAIRPRTVLDFGKWTTREVGFSLDVFPKIGNFSFGTFAIIHFKDKPTDAEVLERLQHYFPTVKAL